MPVCVSVCQVYKWSQLAGAVPLNELGKDTCSGASDVVLCQGAAWPASMQWTCALGLVALCSTQPIQQYTVALYVHACVDLW